MISGRMNDKTPEQSLHINCDMSFSALDLFEGVEAADSTCSRRRNRLAVYDQRTWFSMPPSSAPSRPTRDAQDAPDASFLAPPPEVVVGRLPRSEPAGQHAPLRSRLNDIQDGIQNVIPQVVLPASSGGKITFDLLPLGVRQVGAIALLAHGLGKSFSGKLAGFVRKRGGLPSVFESRC
jgi:hypothetical protein